MSPFLVSSTDETTSFLTTSSMLPGFWILATVIGGYKYKYCLLFTNKTPSKGLTPVARLSLDIPEQVSKQELSPGLGVIRQSSLGGHPE